LAVLDFGQLQEDNGHGKLSGYSGGLGNYHSTASLLFFQNLPALGQIPEININFKILTGSFGISVGSSIMGNPNEPS
ncbi:MAG TPA: hypothetical protein VMT46_00480, partial [Anaerolineaceae bacterium]|nr:hypothetical protein [Anaerolineaceae bacterium]